MKENFFGPEGRPARTGVFAALFAPAGSMVICYAILTAEHGPSLTAAGILSLLLLNFPTLRTGRKEDRMIHIEKETALLRRQSESYLRQLELDRKNQEEFWSLRHDLKNHILQMKQLAETGRPERLADYLEKLMERTASKEIFAETGNPGIDGFLNCKLSEASAAGAGISVRGTVPPDMLIADWDFAVVFGNLLDNAMEAVSRQEAGETRRISLEMQYVRSVFSLRITNTYSAASLTFCRELPETTKGKKAGHGLGLKSVRSAVEKYGGEMTVTAGKGLFTVEIRMIDGKPRKKAAACRSL